MNFLDKINAKFRSYRNLVRDEYYRLLNRLFPSFFDLQERKKWIHSVGYCYPDELFLDHTPAKNKVWAEVIPGFRETYRFELEQDYYEMYRSARFAFTWKKGGWDCLRHYEIIANGCIPVFNDLTNCPGETLSHLPKELIIKANKELLPWKDKPDYNSKYEAFSREILHETFKNASCTAIAEKFLSNLGAKPHHKILFLNCDPNVNYSRELLFIGLNRVQEVGDGLCVGFPKLDYLYESFPIEKASKSYGRGFGYTRRLKDNLEIDSRFYSYQEIETSIHEEYWDFIVYGKMGLDEGIMGTAPTCPFWRSVSKIYKKEKIAFVYGGDHMQDLKDIGSPHTRHLVKHASLGKCFVRELNVL